MPIHSVTPHPDAKTQGDFSALADALLCAHRIIERVWEKLPQATKEAVAPEIDFNFLQASQAVRKVAAVWQAEMAKGNP